jgi:hypothetical protein
MRFGLNTSCEIFALPSAKTMGWSARIEPGSCNGSLHLSTA